MSLFARESRSSAGLGSLENPSTPLTGGELASLMSMSASTPAGVTVNQETALQQIAVTACQRLIAETIATLPVGVFVRSATGVTRQPTPRWLYEPNPDIDFAELVEDVLFGGLGDGNGFAQIVRGRFDDVLELYPQPPSMVRLERFHVKDPLKYLCTDIDGRQTEWTPRNVMHLRAFRRPGYLRGISPIEKHRNAIGLALATEEFGSAFFGQGAHAGGVIETPADLTRDQAMVLVATWVRQHSGLQNAHRPGVLSNGAVWKATTLTNEEAQFLETQKFSVAQIARMYRVPPHLIGDVERSTSWGTGLEEQGRSFVVYTLLPWITRLERALTRLLRPTGNPEGPYVKIDVSELLRGSLKDRFAAYAVGRQWGWLSANAILTAEDQEPFEGGDTYLSPLNMIDAADAGVRPLTYRAQAATFLGVKGAGLPALVAAQLAGLELTADQLALVEAMPDPEAVEQQLGGDTEVDGVLDEPDLDVDGSDGAAPDGAGAAGAGAGDGAGDEGTDG